MPLPREEALQRPTLAKEQGRKRIRHALRRRCEHIPSNAASFAFVACFFVLCTVSLSVHSSSFLYTVLTC